MPEYSGIRRLNHKPLTAVAITAATAGWWVRAMVDPPTMVALAMVGIGLAGVGYFSLRPRLRPHSHSSLPPFPVLVVA